MVKFIETESRIEVIRAGERAENGYCLMGTQFLFRVMQNCANR